MTTITTRQAMDRLDEFVKGASPDDLAEIHNELFPDQLLTDDARGKNSSAMLQKVLSHMKQGLEMEEILDLWNVAFPAHSGVWIDEEQQQVHFEEEAESALHES